MNLNDVKQIQKIDSGRVAESLAMLPEQIKSVWKEAGKIKLPAAWKSFDKIVVFGMGGSIMGAKIINSVFKEELKTPLIIEEGYEVPGFVDNKTLCILSSYSGGTEEVLSVLKKLQNKKAKILAIGAFLEDSALKKISEKEKIIGLFFDCSANPCGQPRSGLGYSMFGLLALLSKTKALKINSEKIKELMEKISVFGKKLDISIKDNPAKKIAGKLNNRGVVILGGEFLEGNLYALRNQFNENGKNFSSYLVLPGMNHHALEGLSFPRAIKKDLIFLSFDSGLYGERVSKRFDLTKQVIKKNKIELIEYSLIGKDKLEQALEMLQFGGWLTFYAGLLNGVNPVLIPWVDWFKKELK